MKIAITSASGQLGSAIIKKLIHEIGAKNIIGIARTPEKAVHLGIEIRQGDYNHREDFEKSLQGVNTVLLISGMDAPQKRIQQHRNVIDAAKQTGVTKIVYTSIVGDENNSTFGSIVQSNRQTEKDIRNSGLTWSIGRNGIYIEPDLEYIDTYQKEGEIRNCAGRGKCAYTSRSELADAYKRMLLDDSHNNETYNLVGEPISQKQLAGLMNQVYGTDLTFNPITSEAYAKERKQELGEFIGGVITGIYEGIRDGAYTIASEYEKAAGRPHKTPIAMIRSFVTHK